MATDPLSLSFELTGEEVHRAQKLRPHVSRGIAWERDLVFFMMGMPMLLASMVTIATGAISWTAAVSIGTGVPLAALTIWAWVRSKNRQTIAEEAARTIRVTIDDDGIAATAADGRRASRLWEELRAIEVADGDVVFRFRGEHSLWIPSRVFANDRERDAFVARARGRVEAFPSPPPPSPKPPAPLVTTPAGVWEWEVVVQDPDTGASVLTLTDPSEPRNRIRVQIKQPTVTAEEIAELTRVPGVRYWVDAAGVEWRLGFTETVLADAEARSWPPHMMQPSGRVWVRASPDATGLPWTDLGHTPHAALLEWFNATS